MSENQEQHQNEYIVALKKSSVRLKELLEENAKLKQKSPVAIIGMACRFPGGAVTPDLFWKNLHEGVDSVIEVPKERWNTEIYHDPNPEAAGKTYNKYSGLISDFDLFDNKFFEISGVEAREMDPQQRLLLEVSYEVLENAGFSISQMRGSKTGVYVGIHSNDHMKAEIASGLITKLSPYSVLGNAFSVSCGRLSYFYDFHGPSVSVDTACSSSITAIHNAVMALNNKDIDYALAGGVNFLIAPEGYIGLSKLHNLSKGSHCRAFDSGADGFVRGEGCGMIMLKRLDDAIADNDNIIGIIKGIATGQDGKSNGIIAPNGLAQEQIIKTAIQSAGITPDDVDWVETHGAGTQLGDTIEVGALTKVFKDRKKELYISSVKTNIGHLESAAGIAAVVKVLLSLDKKVIPSSLHFKEPNPLIPWSETPVVVAKDNVELPQNGKPKITGVSSFGYNGSISHTIFEQAPELTKDDRTSLPNTIFSISAKNEYSLTETTRKYIDYLKDTTQRFQDICYTANISRGEFGKRLAVTAKSTEDLRKKLTACLENSERAALVTSSENQLNKKLVFMFTGQGSQYFEMAADLYQTHPVFKKELDKCAALVSLYVEHSIVDVLYDESKKELLSEAQYAQPVIFSVEYSLAKLLMSFGLKPSLVVGHSIGEYTAACIAGIFALEDAIKIVCIRGKLMHAVDKKGKMAGILTNEEKARELINGMQNISIASVNAPNNVTISGAEDVVDTYLKKVKNNKIFIEHLDISHAFHSEMVKPYAKKLLDEIKNITFNKPQIPIIEDLSGELATSKISSPEYWSEHLYSTLQFNKVINKAESLGYKYFVEVGGTATLTGLAAQCLSNTDAQFFPTLRKERAAWQQLNESLSRLYLAGVTIDWKKYHAHFDHKKVVLPNYAFNKKKFPSGPYPDAAQVKDSTSPLTRQDAEEAFLDERVSIPVAKVAAPQSQFTRPTSEQVVLDIREIISQVSGLDPEEVDQDLNLFSLGLDSLMLIQFMRKVELKYKIEISMNEFLTELNTVKKIGEYIFKILPADFAIAANCAPSANTVLPGLPELPQMMNGNDTDLGNIFKRHIQVLEQQANYLKTLSLDALVKKTPGKPKQTANKDSKILRLKADKLNVKQMEFIKSFISRYNKRTIKSKEYSQQYRNVMADWINTLVFRMTLKEIAYPITPEQLNGARFTDLDGNEYLDICMGRGANFLGHNPPFVVKAIEEQLKKGIGLSTQQHLAGKTAELIRELTGCERVVFSNTGSEAIMAALRIVRTIRKRDKIVRFAGAFHGTFDGIMAEGNGTEVYPSSVGTTWNMVQDLVILNYGAQSSLDYIREHCDELAAVLVEPVQGRNPGFQPKEFLLQLREVTKDTDVPLIFDETLNGFRSNVGGAQAHFGVKADLCTYGKIVGGGMPIGVVAGKAKFIDAIDGGNWNFGDASYPQSDITTFGGTFIKHPLTMAASHAALSYLKEMGNALQEEVNKKTEYLVQAANEYFELNDVPLKVNHFGSQFRFQFLGESALESELFNSLMIYRGIYMWERRINSLSIAHTNEDMDTVLHAVKSSVEELRQGGFAFTKSKTQPVDDTVCYPVSSHQSRLFILCQNENTERAYHITKAFLLDGKLDLDRLKYSVDQLIQKHESLRTGFSVIGDQIFQIVHKAVPSSIDYFDATTTDYEALINDFIKPFDIAKPSLLRIGVARVEANKHVLLIDLHHIIADGFSLNSLTPELMKLYNGEINSIDGSEYMSFVDWENEYKSTNKYVSQKGYWLNKLQGELSICDLPTDLARPKEQYHSGKTHYFEIDNERVKKIKRVAKKYALTDYMLILSAFKILIHKLNGSDDIVVGTPVTIRPGTKYDTAIGMFTNTIVMRSNPSTNKTLLAYLNEIKADCLQSYANMEFPFEDLVQNLNLGSDRSRNPLFSTMFVYEKADSRSFSFKGLEAQEVTNANVSSIVDLILEVLEVDGKFTSSINYADKLFHGDTINRWIGYYIHILDQLIGWGDHDEFDSVPLGDLTLLSQDEENQILNVFNNTSTDYQRDKSIVNVFEDQVNKTPNNVAIVFGDKRLTYRELNEESNKIASHLIREHKVSTEDFVGILLERGELMIISILGILKAGGAYMPIDHSYPQERIDLMLKDCHPKVVLSTTKFREKLKNGNPVFWDEINLNQYSQENPGVKVHADNLAYIMFTSGSTGMPKGILIEHRNVVRLVKNTNFTDLSTGDHVLQLSSYSFDGSTYDIFGSLLNGSTLYMIELEVALSIPRLADFIEEHKINITFITTALFNALAEIRPTIFKYFDKIYFGGEQASLNHIKIALDNRKTTDAIVHVYGPTESTTFASFCVMDYSNIRSNAPIGGPISNTSLYVLDKEMRPVPIGISGEICIGGDGLSRGYFKDEALTASKFVTSPFNSSERLYKTGDLGRWLPDGNIEFLGRIDNQVKIRGFRIEPGEIEYQLIKHAPVKECLVMPRDLGKGKELVAYVVLNDQQEKPAISELRSFINKTLPVYMIPAHFVFIDQFTLNVNGKIDRKALPLPALTVDDSTYIAPQGEVEEKIARAIQKVLRMERIGVHDNFFEIGGDSIKALQISSELFQEGITLELKHIFSSPTIAGMASLVSHESATISQAVVSGSLPLTPVQKWFFENHSKDVHHFNHSMMIFKADGFNEQHIEAALEQLVVHHDALRMVYTKGGNGIYEQHNRGVEGKLYHFEKHAVKEAQAEAAIESVVNTMHASMDLSTGPLLKCGLIKTQEGDHLLFIIHHLVVDGVSWRILLEDFSTLYKQQEASVKVQLAKKTHSFREWSEQLSSYSQDHQLSHEVKYWESLEKKAITSIKEKKSARNSQGDQKNIMVELGAAETSLLLSSTNRAYNTEINDLLLTALVRSIKSWKGLDQIKINLEGHGRENIISGININRTVGWFTSIYPVHFSLAGDTLRSQIIGTKETLRQVPDKGIGYGIWKYLSNHQAGEVVQPELSFNYLGQLDNTVGAEGISVSGVNIGEGISGAMESEQPITINCLVRDNKFQLNVSYHVTEFHEHSIASFAHLYLENLSAVIQHCSTQQESERTPSDYGDSTLNVEELNSILVLHHNNVESIYPLAPLQEGMLFHSLVDPQSSSYFEQAVYKLSGKLNFDVLERSYNKLIKRHDILRTSFVHKGLSKTRQVVLGERVVKVKVTDVSDLTPEKAEEAIETILSADRGNKFNLTTDSLTRMQVIKTAGEGYLLVWSFHHIIMDGWCLMTILKELSYVYEQLLKKAVPQLPALEPYKNFIGWLNRKDKEKGLSFWSAYLSGHDEVSNLPLKKENVQGGYDAQHVYVKLSGEQSEGLKKLAQGNQVTINTIFQALWGLLLQRYNNSNDVVFGAVTSGRPTDLRGAQEMVGLFINTVPVRVKSEAGQSFSELVKQIQSQSAKVKAFEYVSLSEIQSQSSLKSDLVNHIIAFESYPFDAKLFSSIKSKTGFEILEGEINEFTNYDFSITISPGDVCEIKMTFNARTFNADTVNRIGDHFSNVIDSVIKNADAKVDNLTIISEQESQKILYGFNDVITDYPNNKSIVDVFEDQVIKTPDNIAIEFGDKKLTYRELNEEANKIASHLIRKHKVGTEDFVGILLERGELMIISILGILKAGAAYMPIDPSYPLERIDLMLKDCNPKVILSNTKFRRQLTNGNSVFWDDINLNQYSKKNPGIKVHAYNLAYVMYTSGSTGNPKGALIEHRSVVRLVRNTNYFHFSESDRIMQTCAPVFDVTTFEYWGALLNGGALILIEEENLLNVNFLDRELKARRVTMMWLTTGLFNSLVEQNIGLFSSLKYLLVGGDVLSPLHINKVLRENPTLKIINGYGPTENTTFSTTYLIECEFETTIPIGKPISNSTVYIMSKSGRLQPIGVPGELYLGGDGLSRGYLHDEALTTTKFITSPFNSSERLYKTGDLGRWLPDGNVEFLGRIDNQVKIRGFRIEPGEIEYQLGKHALVKQCLVMPRDLGKGKELIAYVVLHDQQVKPSISELRGFINETLPVYMIPAHFVFIDQFTLNVSGKIDRKALPHPTVTVDESTYVAPQGEVEQKIARAIQKVLRIERIGAHDNFFEIGGDSIKALQISSELFQEGITLELKHIFSSPTIAGMASLVSHESTSISQGVVSGSLPLTPVQKWFFENHSKDVHHFNRSMMIFKADGFNEQHIEAALEELVVHHDALRMGYTKGGNGVYEQHNRGVEGKLYHFEKHAVKEVQAEAAIENIANTMHSSMDVSAGPLLKCGLIKTQEGDHLLFVIHHLVVDGVSWRILLEDFSTLYEQQSEGMKLQLAKKTHSFKEWAEQLSAYAQDHLLSHEVKYWKSVGKKAVKSVKEKTGARNHQGDQKNIMVELGAEETGLLLSATNRAYNTEINDLLLTALVRSIKSWKGLDQIKINLEGHGREDIIPGTDINRTVGWFNSIYPVHFSLRDDSLRSQIIGIKETLRQVPDKGIGYGIWKYLSNQKTDNAIEPEISFNYLGQLDNTIGSENMSVSGVNIGEGISRAMESGQPLTINCLVRDNKFQFNFCYHQTEFHEHSIANFAHQYLENLSAVIQHCLTQQESERTPGDYGDSTLSLEELNSIIALHDNNVERIYSLAPMQEGMLFHSLVDPQSSSYFEQKVYKLKGTIDADVLEKSYNTLIKRHDILRTSFVHKGLSKPRQVVLGERAVKVKLTDVSNLSPAESQDTIENILSDDRANRFNLTTDNLSRMQVIRTAGDGYLLVWSFHHIIIDGWCLMIILKELSYMYEQLLKKAVPQLPALEPYKNFIGWLNRKDKEKGLSFWSTYLSGHDEVSNLPLKKENVQGGYDAQHVYVKLSQAQSDGLKKLAQSNQVTINTIFQALWGLLLQRYNNSNDVVFGAVTSGRPTDLRGAQEMVGLFINTVPVRVKSEAEQSFSELVKQIQNQSAQVKAFEYVSLSEIQSQTSLKGDLINHVIGFENYPFENKLFTEIKSKTGFEILGYDLTSQTNYDFNIIIFPGDLLEMMLTFNACSYDHDTINSIANHFSNAIEYVIQSPDEMVASIDILSVEEKNELINQFSNNLPDYPGYPDEKNAVKLFEVQVEKVPDNTALIFEDTRLTYKALNEKVNQVANYLREEISLQPESVVGIMMERSEWMIISILAVMKAGAAYLPIDPAYPEERVKYMLGNSNAKLVITKGAVKNIDTATRVVDVQKIGNGKVSNLDLEIAPSNLAYVIYTSGSTGNPKGVMIEHKGIINLFYSQKKAFDITDKDVVMQFASMSFDASVWEMIMALFAGAALVVTTNETIHDVDKFKTLMIEEKVSIITLPPTYLRQLNQTPFPDLRILITAGDSPDFDDVIYYSKTTKYFNAYGPTEYTVCSSFHLFTETDLRLKNIGKSIANTSMYILDKNQQLMPVGAAGELCIAGRNIARGYLNRPDLTAQKFIPNPFRENERMYRTGDMAKMLPDGNVEFLGRVDDQVKIRGHRIDPEEIVAVLAQHEGVYDCTVIADDFGRGEKELAAYVVHADGSTDHDASDIRKYLAGYLPAFMMPSYFVFLYELPLTPNGKIDKKLLKEQKSISTLKAYMPPVTETEKVLAGIWEEVIGLEKIGMTDNFFELGGNSILAIQIVSRLKRFSDSLTVKDIFQYPTIGQLSENCRTDHITSSLEVQVEEANDLERLLNTVIPGQSNIDDILSSIKSQQAEFNSEIVTQTITNEYPLSGMQNIHLMMVNVNTVSSIPFYYSIDQNTLNGAFTKVLSNQGALRCRLGKSDQGVCWQEFDAPSSVRLPFVDLTNFKVESQYTAVLEINKQLLQINFAEGDTLMYVAYLAKFSDERYSLEIICSHLLMDAMSANILKNSIEEYYRGLIKGKKMTVPAIESYSSFVNQINNSLNTTASDEVDTKYNIDDFYHQMVEAEVALKEKFPEQFENGLQELFVLNKLVDINGIEEKNIWDLCFTLYGKLLSELFDTNRVPLFLVSFGRKYGKTTYFNTVGDFVDILPLLIATDSVDPMAISQSANTLIEFAQDKSLSFSNIAFTSNFKYAGWQKISNMIRSLLVNKMRSFNIFNFLGKSTEEDFVKHSDYERMLMESNTHDSGYINCSIRYTNSKLLFTFKSPFPVEEHIVEKLFNKAAIHELKTFLTSVDSVQQI